MKGACLHKYLVFLITFVKTTLWLLERLWYTTMSQKWEQADDNGEIFGALLTDLSKGFDCLDHELLIAKLNGYRLSLPV